MNRFLIGFLVGVLLTGTFFCWEADAAEWQGMVIHITDSVTMSKEDCDDWHMEQGWDSCGYNVVIDESGVLYEGRGLDKVGAHVKGHNSKFLGVAFVTKDAITDEQLKTFLAFKKQAFPTLPMYPHHQFNHGKRCPGQALEQIRRVA